MTARSIPRPAWNECRNCNDRINSDLHAVVPSPLLIQLQCTAFVSSVHTDTCWSSGSAANLRLEYASDRDRNGTFASDIRKRHLMKGDDVELGREIGTERRV